MQVGLNPVLLTIRASATALTGHGVTSNVRQLHYQCHKRDNFLRA